MKVKDLLEIDKITVVKNSILIIQVPNEAAVKDISDLLNQHIEIFKEYKVEVLVLSENCNLTLIPGKEKNENPS